MKFSVIYKLLKKKPHNVLENLKVCRDGNVPKNHEETEFLRVASHHAAVKTLR